MELNNDQIDGELVFSYPQEEKPDWGYARNRSFVLKRPDTCWSSSLFSVTKDGFILPNRDHPQQGLLFRVGGEYTKFLDAPMFKLLSEGEEVNMEPAEVKLTPWKATYIYRSESTTLEVTYYLSPSGFDNKAGGWIKFNIDSSLEDLELIVSPLVDIRKVGEESPDISDYDISTDQGVLCVSKKGKELMIGGSESMMDHREQIQWGYKLGDGYREVADGEVRFKEEKRDPVKMGALTFELSKRDEVKIGIACGKDLDRSDVEFFGGSDVRKDEENAREILERFDFSENDMEARFEKARLVAFPKFAVREGGIDIPGAGEWWFKDVWFRDLFESLYHEMDFYRELKGDEWIKKVLTWARIYLKDGIMAVKADDNDPAYNSIDAALLYLLCAAKYYEKTGDENFRENMKKTFDSVVESLGEDDGLVRCGPEYSWMDSVVDGRATRIPDSWDVEDEAEYLLPEVNAMWIRVLEEYNKIYGADENVKKAWNSFKETFWDDKKGFVYHIVYRDGDEEKKDSTESSAAVVSLALLKDYFFGYELLDAWKTVKERLLVYRKPLYFDENHIPFGILTRNSKKRVYMGDAEYHEAVMWPRDSTYLFEILEKIGRTGIKKEITKNMLDHQMSEGAIFYNHELFSLPEGKNPCETSLSSNPVPVKNPIQLWSHFLPDSIETRKR